MKFSSIRWLVCLAAGMALGFIAAQKRTGPSSPADVANRPDGVSISADGRAIAMPSCCEKKD